LTQIALWTLQVHASQKDQLEILRVSCLIFGQKSSFPNVIFHPEKPGSKPKEGGKVEKGGKKGGKKGRK
jgi:hypothetical protein